MESPSDAAVMDPATDAAAAESASSFRADSPSACVLSERGEWL
jgi:hypothetical protein